VSSPSRRTFTCGRAPDGSAIARFATWPLDVRWLRSAPGSKKFIPTGAGLFGFDTADEAVDAIAQINADYPRHARVAREIAAEFFDR